MFNSILMAGGIRTFYLAVTTNQLGVSYNVENAILAAYPTITGTRPGDQIYLTINAGITMYPPSTSSYAIDGSTLNSQARLTITIGAGANIMGKGGAGGKGGSWSLLA